MSVCFIVVWTWMYPINSKIQKRHIVIAIKSIKFITIFWYIEKTIPYPITFLCTDFISELYGKRRANIIVWVGLVLNIWVLFILWLGAALPPHPVMMEDGLPAFDDPSRAYFQIKMFKKIWILFNHV